jgi:L-lysine 2,3-aminomutase
VPIVKGYSIVEKAKQQLDGHAKRFKYVMSHRTGKVEILGVLDGYVYFRYHQCKDPEKVGVLFKRKLVPEGGWLDDFPPLPGDPAEEVLKHYSTSH